MHQRIDLFSKLETRRPSYEILVHISKIGEEGAPNTCTWPLDNATLYLEVVYAPPIAVVFKAVRFADRLETCHLYHVCSLCE